MTTTKEIAARISCIRYGEPGKILFHYAGHSCAIKEPRDVMLVGSVGAAQWIAECYGLLLSALTPIHARTRVRQRP